MKKVVLVGAGSLQFGTGMLGDLLFSPLFRKADIVLHDINGEALQRVKKLGENYCQKKGYSPSLSATTDLSIALKGTDFVIISIEVGNRFALWEQDWRIPQQYGIRQLYGENGGVGGLFHSLRIIPPILDICQEITKIAPKAVVFNFSNPMSRICTTVHRRFPELTFIGMCHEVASLERYLPPLLETPRDNLHYRAAGLNHFSVLLEVSYVDSGKDAYPDVRKRAESFFRNLPGPFDYLKGLRTGKKSVETEGWGSIEERDFLKSSEKGTRLWSERRLFRDFFGYFGFLPITSDSHLGEYLPWAHDCADKRAILDFYTYYRSYLQEEVPIIREQTSERAVPIMEALISGEEYEEAAVNIPNKGYIPELPPWMVVEVPARVNSQGVEGVKMALPAGIAGLLTNQIGIHNMTTEAILRRSRDLVIQALLVDPTVTISREIPDLVDQMICEQRPWLDYLG